LPSPDFAIGVAQRDLAVKVIPPMRLTDCFAMAQEPEGSNM
jgi:hypothetical protein